MTLINYSETDISYQTAYDAHRATSHVPEKRAKQVIDGYLSHMAEINQKFKAFVTPNNEEPLKADLETYRQTYITKYNALLHAKSRVMSAFITGPANFPTARNQKRANTEDKRRQEFLDFQEKALKRLNQKYNPVAIANAPISSDDDNALTKLQAKIEAAIRLQTRMKMANRAPRKYGDPKPHPSSQLTNNNANIRRMKARIIELEREFNRDEVEDWTIAIKGTEATVSENQGENRLQLFFEGKPAAEVRTILKQNGFRWSPSQGAWQRKLNDNARRTLDYIKDND